MQLTEKYRPSTWSEIVGQDKAVAVARRIIERPGFDRGAFWIDAAGANNSGVGKSSLARVIARHLAEPWNTYIHSGADVSRDLVREWQGMNTVAMSDGRRPFRAVLIDEAHAIGQAALDLLLVFLDPLPRHWMVVFTTTRQPDAGLFGDDNGPLYSRCTRVRLTNQGIAEPIARRIAEIARMEGLGEPDESAAMRLVRECKSNVRACLQAVESGYFLASA